MQKEKNARIRDQRRHRSRSENSETPQTQRKHRHRETETETERWRGRQRETELSCEGSGGQEGCPPSDLLAQPREDSHGLFSSQWFKLYSGFLKFLPGAHRQVYKTCRKSRSSTTVWRRSVKPWTSMCSLLSTLLLPDFIELPARLDTAIQEAMGGERGGEKTRGEKGGERSRRIG